MKREKEYRRQPLQSGWPASLRCWTGLSLLLFPALLSAQFSNLRSQVIDAGLPVQALDSLTIAVPLIAIADSATGIPLPAEIFTLQNNFLLTDTARLHALCPDCARLRISYRLLPVDLAARLSRLDTNIIRRPGAPDDDIRFDYSPYEPPRSLLGEGSTLNTNGAYTRGLSFGNSQNLVFNSNLNLQLDGKLGNDLELRAALSDNSIPLQPDGTTRQLQEFDRIFIQLKRKNSLLTAGDYDLTRPTGYFSNYFKRLQGGMFETSTGKSLRDTFNFRTAAAVSRGKFNRQAIQGQEGNQGPYRLQGAEGERFIIVLAGTEKVYVDGVLLRRGLEDDYVMDYNLAELSFTPRRLITKDSRIIVEFEYAVQVYLRSTVAANADWRSRRGRAWFNAYSEQDGKNAGGAQDLSPEQRHRLAEVGDDLQNAYASGIDTLSASDIADPSRVRYKLADTLACGSPVQVLVYSTSTDSARYAARFTEVPQGQGNYIQVASSANGRVFRWVAPDPVNCQPAGNFEPVVRLVAPESRQLYTAGADFQLFGKTRLSGELALSNRDLNRFSPLGNGDNAGLAGFFSLRQNLLSEKTRRGWQADLLANYEVAGREFQPLNPYRPAEFTRDWNVGTATAPAPEHLAKGGISLGKKGWGGGRYELGAFVREGFYEGIRHLAQAKLNRNGYEIFGEANLLATDGLAEHTRFSRPKMELAKTFFLRDTTGLRPLLKIGLYGEREKNERRPLAGDTLSTASFWYDLGRIYLQMPDADRAWQIGGSFTRRDDYFPAGGFFKKNTSAEEANINGKWQAGNRKQNLSWNLSYRNLHIIAPELTDQEAQETYLGRVDYSLSTWKNALSLNTGYELGSGQSPKLEFNYVQVNPGEGQFTWVDRNRDSILQVDEMELAVFQDQANYVRIAVTTTDYVRTNNVVLSQSLRLEPRLLWSNRKGWRRLLSRFSTQTTLQVNRRTYANAGGISPWNPFALVVADTALVTVNSAVRNVLFLNRADPVWDASLAQGDQRGRLALTTGFESRRLADVTAHGRVNLSQQWTLETDVAKGLKTSDNEAFASRDYHLDTWLAGPKITWLPNRSFRILGSISRSESRNSLGEQESARQTNWSAELTWNPVAKANAQGFRPATSLRAKGTFADIRYTGEANTSVAYAMLVGLQDGRNFLWSLTLDRQISKTVQLNLNYEGRKTGEGRVVHVGRAQVRAVF